MKVNISRIDTRLVNSLIKKQISRTEAKITANEYLEEELQNIISHELLAFPSLLRKLDHKRKKFKIIEKTDYED